MYLRQLELIKRLEFRSINRYTYYLCVMLYADDQGASSAHIVM